MTDKIIENKEPKVDPQDLTLLIRNEQGRLLIPLSPNWSNLLLRAQEDENDFLLDFQKRLNKRGVLKIEIIESENVVETIKKAQNIVFQSQHGKPPSREDLEDFARYLDWSYQQQVGIPANTSNQEEAIKYGVGALDTWALFTAIKNKLEK